MFCLIVFLIASSQRILLTLSFVYVDSELRTQLSILDSPVAWIPNGLFDGRIKRTNDAVDELNNRTWILPGE